MLGSDENGTRLFAPDRRDFNPPINSVINEVYDALVVYSQCRGLGNLFK